MKVAIMRTTVDRKTGAILKEEIKGYENVDENIFFSPLVEIYGNIILKKLKRRIKNDWESSNF